MGGQEGVVRSTVDEDLDRWDENVEDSQTTDPDPVVGDGVNVGDCCGDGGGGWEE